MNGPIATAAVHHFALTVTDVERSQTFYSEVLGFELVPVPLPGGVLLSNGTVLLGIRTATDPSQAAAGDRFNENRIGLDHLSFAASSRAGLERAAEVLDRYNVPHGDISEAPQYGLVNLFFRDPDNIQLELSAPLG
jgi:catechol 2,3-dioxygenase-like lactoylglutathione lyase family enzyme